MAECAAVTDEEYSKALDALSSLISSNRRRTDGANWESGYQMMRSYLERLGLEDEVPKLSVIHVAGTKGKGSTCAMVESMLRTAGYSTGLYTSPHLVDVRERIRINGEPVDKASFLRNLWWCYNTLKEKATDEQQSMAAYFRFLTLLGFKIFLEKQVDVVILEVGIGGRLDATNCVQRPVACGVSSLGFDHMELLGNTLPEIATEKAGIFKPGVPAFTVWQPEDALQALQRRADAVGAPLTMVRPWDRYSNAAGVALGLAGEHQKVNAGLALALTGTWEASSPVAAARSGGAAAARAASVAAGVIPAEYAAGLESASWPGRGQLVHDYQAAEAAAGSGPRSNGQQAAAAAAHTPRLSFFLDGAHTAESMVTCGQWFADASSQAERGSGGEELVTQRVLLFNCMQEREPQKLLQPLAQTLAERQLTISHALFVPPDSHYFKVGSGSSPSAASVDLSWQHSLRSVWESFSGSQRVAEGTAGAARQLPQLPPLPATAAAAPLSAADAARGAVLPNLRVTLDWLRRCVREVPTLRMHVLVSGSLYLVGDMLKLLGSGSSPAVSSSKGDKKGS